MTKTLQLLFIIALGQYGCSNAPKNSKPTEEQARSVKLQSFLKKIPILTNQPYILTFEYPASQNELVKLDENSSDTLFVGYAPNALIYGLLPDTDKFFSVLWYTSVENGALTLTTLDKTGNIICEKQLSTGLYGGGCGYGWHGLVYTKDDHSFFMRDSIITYDCDSGIPPIETWKHEIVTTSATVLTNGKIQFSEINRTTVNNRNSH